MSLGCVKAFSILRNLTRRDVADKVHNKISETIKRYYLSFLDSKSIALLGTASTSKLKLRNIKVHLNSSMVLRSLNLAISQIKACFYKS